MKQVRPTRSRLAQSFRKRVLILAVSLVAALTLQGPLRALQRSPETVTSIVQRARRALASFDSLSFDASLLQEGPHKDRRVASQGRVLVQRLGAGNPLGFRLRCEARYQIPILQKSAAEQVLYDGRRVLSLDPETGRVQDFGPYETEGKKHIGYSRVLWWRFTDASWLDRLMASHSLAYAGNMDVRGVPCVLLKDEGGSGVRTLYAFSTGDGFLREVDQTTDERDRTTLIVSALRQGVQVDLRSFAPSSLVPGSRPGTNSQNRDRDDAAERALPSLLTIGSQAPSWTLQAPDGSSRRLEDYGGRVLVMDFWATWCAPCLASMPFIQAIYEDYRSRGLSVVGISTSETGDDLKYMRLHGFSYSLVRHGERLMNPYKFAALPTLYILDRQGKVLYASSGLLTPAQENSVRRLLERVLTKGRRGAAGDEAAGQASHAQVPAGQPPF